MELSANYIQEFLINFLHQNPALVKEGVESQNTSELLEIVRGYLMERDIEAALESLLEQ